MSAFGYVDAGGTRSRMSRSSFLVALGALGVVSGCDRAVTHLTTEKASWVYVVDAWGGVGIREPELTATEIRLPTGRTGRKSTLADSAICCCGGDARVDGRRILISLNRCVCSGRTPGVPEAFTLPRPAPGMYEVAYDDESVGYPELRPAIVVP